MVELTDNQKKMESALGLWVAQEEFATVSNYSCLAWTAISAPLVCLSSKKNPHTRHKKPTPCFPGWRPHRSGAVVGKYLTPTTGDRGVCNGGRPSESASVALQSLWRLCGGHHRFTDIGSNCLLKGWEETGGSFVKITPPKTLGQALPLVLWDAVLPPGYAWNKRSCLKVRSSH